MAADGGLDNWYTKTSSNTDVYYSHATDPLLHDWSSPVSACHDYGRLLFPNVFQGPDGTRYMIAKEIDGDLYMWTLPTVTTCRPMNGGSPVWHHSKKVNDWNNKLNNTGAAIVGTTIYAVVEASPYPASLRTYRMGFSYTSLTDLKFDTHAVPITRWAVSPQLLYLPHRGGLMAVVGYVPNMPNGITEIRLVTALLTDNLALPASWHLSSNSVMAKSGIHLADPSLVDTTTGPTGAGRPPLVILYNFNQIDTRAAWGNMTLDQLWDSARITPVGPQTPRNSQK